MQWLQPNGDVCSGHSELCNPLLLLLMQQQLFEYLFHVNSFLVTTKSGSRWTVRLSRCSKSSPSANSDPNSISNFCRFVGPSAQNDLQ